MSAGRKHVATVITAALCFAIGSALLFLGRAGIATSTPLLVVIVGFFVAAIGLAFPSSMAAARRECIEWYRAWQDAKRPPQTPSGGQP